MVEKQPESKLSEVLLRLDSPAPAPPTDAGREAQRVLRQDRRRITIAALAAGALWLVAAALVFFLLYAFYHELVLPRVRSLDAGTYRNSAPPTHEEAVKKARHDILVIRNVVFILGAALASVTAAALTTIALIVLVRQATLRQISSSLRAVVEHLNQTANQRSAD